MNETNDTKSLSDRLIAHLSGGDTDDRFPKAISHAGEGGKFLPNGDVLHFPGNTFICHLDRKSKAFAAMSRIQDAMKNSAYAHYFSFLPKSSFHMTVFCGISGNPLGADGWPKKFPAETGLAQFTDAFLENLQHSSFPSQFQVQSKALRAGYSLRLSPSSLDQETILRGARDRLREITGLYRDDHKIYEFHSTLAYPISWIPEGEAIELVEFSNSLFDAHIDELSLIELGPIEFCTFDNMHAFRPLAELGENGPVPLRDCGRGTHGEVTDRSNIQETLARSAGS